MKLSALKIFCGLAETRSFTKAARSVGITQSAVSQTLSSLERRFDSRLVERSKKNPRLTPEGQVLYDYSKKILQFELALQAKMQEIHNEVIGTIRVAAIYSIGLHELPPYVRKFMAAHPQVNVHVTYRRVKDVYEDVLDNSADFGLVAYPTRSQVFQTIPLRSDPLVIICHPQHLFAKLKSVKLEDIAGQSFVGFDPETPTRTELDKILRQHKIEVRTVMEFDNVETVKRAVEIDSGVAIVPLPTVSEEVSKKTLAVVMLDGQFSRPIAAICKSNKILSPSMKEFIAVLQGNSA